MLRKSLFYWSLLVLMLLISACAAQPTGTQSVNENPPDLENTNWQLVSFDTPDSETPVASGSQISLRYDEDGQAGGSAGCNSYGGAYAVDQGQLSFSEMISTLMACADSTVMEQEAEYLEALQSTGAFELTADRLLIHYEDGEKTLNFVRLSE